MSTFRLAHCTHRLVRFFFFFNDTATTEIYTLSLHDALPIWKGFSAKFLWGAATAAHQVEGNNLNRDRKSTRLNSSHSQISYAVFCLKKKKTNGEFTLRCACRMTRNRYEDSCISANTYTIGQ